MNRVTIIVSESWLIVSECSSSHTYKGVCSLYSSAFSVSEGETENGVISVLQTTKIK